MACYKSASQRFHLGVNFCSVLLKKRNQVFHWCDLNCETDMEHYVSKKAIKMTLLANGDEERLIKSRGVRADGKDGAMVQIVTW